MNKKSIIYYEKMASFNVMFFDIHCDDINQLIGILSTKLKERFSQSICDYRYRILEKIDANVDNNDVVLFKIRKFDTKPINVEVHDEKDDIIDNAKTISNTNYILIDTNRKVLLLHTSKNGINISILKNIIDSNSSNFNVYFTVKIAGKELKDLKNIKKLTISQKTEKTLFTLYNKNHTWNDVELGTITIKITARRGGHLPKNKINEEIHNITTDHTSFNVKTDNGEIYDFIKHRLQYTNSRVPENANTDWYQREIQEAYKSNIKHL